MTAICQICKGMGTRVACYPSPTGFQFWPCQGCGGSGVRFMHGPAEIKLGKAQSGFLKPIAKVAAP
jgi:hypothetical protein